MDGCTCISNEEARRYYPEWATERDIDLSQKIMWQRFENENIRLAAQTTVVNFNGEVAPNGGSGSSGSSMSSAESMEAPSFDVDSAAIMETANAP